MKSQRPFHYFLALLTIVSAGLGCDKKQDDDGSLSDASAFIMESGVSALSGVADDQNGGSYASMHKPYAPSNYLRAISATLLPEAFAAGVCSRPAATMSCSSGVRSTTYDDCSIGFSIYRLEGSVTLTYSDTAGCTLDDDGDTVTRTYDYTISGPRGGELSVSSEAANNYLSESISGGGRLEKVSGGYEVEILGKHKVLKFRNIEIFNHSLKSIAPSTITGGLSRANRVIDGGTLRIYHNKARYYSDLEPDNLTWSSSCGCHPTSGSLTATYSGSIQGTATLTYTDCGKGELSLLKDGESTPDVSQFEHSYCE